MNINKNFVDNNNGEIYMKKIIVSVLLVLLVGVSTIMGTYAVIINVVSDNGVDKIVNVINIKDLLSDDNGNYNSTYYDVRDELNISDSEMDVLMNSSYLNDSLKIVLDNVVSYKLRGGTKLSNDDIYNMIVNDVNNDDSINNILKNKVIDKSNVYRSDISDYIYDLDVNLISDLLFVLEKNKINILRRLGDTFIISGSFIIVIGLIFRGEIISIKRAIPVGADVA